MKHPYSLLSHLVLLWVLFGLIGAIAVQANAEEAVATAQVSSESDAKALPAGVVEIDVVEIHCSTCAKKLTRKLYVVKGVKKVDASVSDNSAVIELTKEAAIDPKAIWQAAVAGGTEPTELRYLDQVVTAEQMKKMLESEENKG